MLAGRTVDRVQVVTQPPDESLQLRLLICTKARQQIDSRSFTCQRNRLGQLTTFLREHQHAASPIGLGATAEQQTVHTHSFDERADIRLGEPQLIG